MVEVEYKNVTKKYDDGSEAVKELNLEIKDGEFLVLLGPSGCGKSTTLRMLAGLEEVTEGEIEIDGMKINHLPPGARGLGMVFQSYALYPHMTVFNNMAFGLKLEKRPKDEILDRVHEAAKILQIEEYLERKPKQLSGGQRQRVAIGRAITRKPKVFLFDEPLSNLDAALRVQMRVELAKLHDTLEATMIYVTHDQTEAMTLADEIVVLDKGFISQKGSPMELYNKPNNLFVGGFIGSPKMNFINAKILSSSSKSYEISFLDSVKIKLNKNGKEFKDNEDVILGVRPEHLSVSNSNSKWEGKVFVVEKLGSGTFLYLENVNEPIVVQTEGDTKIKTGDKIKIGIDLSKCHIFKK